MFNQINLSLKWLYFIIIFKSNFSWMTATTEGGIYLKEKLTNLGILGIKLGQYLYSHSLLINDEVKDALEPLLSHNKIHTKKETRQMLDFDDSNKCNDSNKCDESIESIDYDNILGSGSLAQTHICYLKNDASKKYVLKVAHPEILNLENEVNVVKNLFKIVSFFINIKVNWNSFFENISEQCDLNNEANYMKKFYEIYKNYDKIEIPELVYSNKYFIIMSFCEGIQINKLDKHSEEYINACKLIYSCFIHTSYKYNIIHGDLHPGNILVKENGDISLLDFGICIELNKNSNRILYNIKKLLLFNTKEYFFDFFKNMIHNYYSYMLKISMNKYNKIIHEIHETLMILNDSTMKTFINKFINLCREENVILLENNIFTITQMTLLEELFVIKQNRNARCIFKVLYYMKNENFFMNEMSSYILDFYELEYSALDNDKDNIKDNIEKYI